MAKKTVASLQTASKRLSKAIKMVKSPNQELILLLNQLWILPMLISFYRKNKNHLIKYTKLLSISESSFFYGF